MANPPISLDDLVSQYNPPAKSLSLDDALAQHASSLDQDNGWQPTQYGFKVRPITLDIGGKPVQTVQREDGSAYFGPDQGNTGKPGWFDAQGNRMGSTPGAEPDVNPLVKLISSFGKPESQVYGQGMSGGITPEASQIVATQATAPLQKVAQVYSRFPSAPGAQKVKEALAQIQANRAKLISEDKSGAAQALDTTSELGTQGALAEAIGLPDAIEKFAAPYLVKGAGALPAIYRGIQTGIAQGAGFGLLHGVSTPQQETPDNQNLPAYLANEAGRQVAETSHGATAGGVFGGAVSTIPALGSVLSNGMRRLIVGKYGPAAQEVINDFTSQGVEARPSTILNAAKVATPSEEVVAAKGATDKLIQDLAQNTENTPYRGLDRIQQAAQAGDTEARDLLGRIGQPDQSPSQIAQNSGAVQAKRAQLIKNDLWQKVDALAGEKGVPLPQTYDAIQAIRSEMAQKGGIPGLSDELDRLERYFPQRDPNTGRMVAPLNPDNNFGSLKLDAVQRLNDILAAPADSADGYALQRAAGRLKNALEGDMHDFAANSGNDALWNAYNRANAFHREVYAPTQQAQPFNIQNLFATDKANNPSFADQLIAKLGQKSSGPDRAAAVANALGQKGRAAFAQALVENSIGKGIVDRTGTWVPGGAASDLASRMDTINALLPKGPERMQVQGALNMLQHLAKASPENASALGERFAQVAGAGEGITGQIAKAYKFIKDGGIDVLFNSPQGKQYLFQMGDAKPGSKMADNILKKMMALKASSSLNNVMSFNPALAPAASTQSQEPTDITQIP